MAPSGQWPMIAAPTANDPALARQREMLSKWRAKAEDRDLSVVEVIGNQVSGASDSGAAIRRGRTAALKA